MHARRLLLGALLTLSCSCGGSNPTVSSTTPTPPIPTPTPPPEPGFVLIRAVAIDWPATDPQIGFDIWVPSAGDVLIELVDVVIADQTSATQITLSLHPEDVLGGRPQCVEFVTRCTGISEDEVVVPQGGAPRRLAATAAVAAAGPYFVMLGNWGPTGTVRGTLKAWFRPNTT
jgi:hypothetical protein